MPITAVKLLIIPPACFQHSIAIQPDLLNQWNDIVGTSILWEADTRVADGTDLRPEGHRFNEYVPRVWYVVSIRQKIVYYVINIFV